jgi:hypothetical protein
MAQHPNIFITDMDTPCEPTIKINPFNTNQIMAGSNINLYCVSSDGGLTWTTNYISSPTYGVWGDPCIVVDNDQNFFYFHLSYPPAGNWIDRIVCQKSEDFGLTWNDGSYMGLDVGNSAQDKEWAIVNRSNNHIYATWTHFDEYGSEAPSDVSKIKFSKSIDGGESWSEAVVINEVDGNCIDSSETVEGAVPAVGPNGEIYVSWAGPEGLVFDKSYDEGETWLDEDIFVNEFPGGWDIDIPGINRSNGLPVTVCDTSGGPHNGTIYINWVDQRNGSDDTDVWIAKSTDQGETWTEAIRVNDDEPGKHQFLTWVDIDQTNGYLYFIFYDRRNYDDNKTDVYMAVSKDGGETFDNFKINEEHFTPSDAYFFGDYNNISAYNDVIRPIWTSLNTEGYLKILTAIINPDAIGVDQIQKEPEISLEEAYPNPFKVETTVKLKLKTDQYINVIIYDILGNMVTNLSEGTYDRGKHLIRFNPAEHNLKNGVYFLCVKGPNIDIRKKVIYID